MTDAGGLGITGTEAWEEIITGGDPGRAEKDGSASSSTKSFGPKGGNRAGTGVNRTDRERIKVDTGIEVGDTGDPGQNKGEGTPAGRIRETESGIIGTPGISAGHTGDDSDRHPETEDEETPLVIKSWGNVQSRKETTPTTSLIPAKKPKETTPQRKQSLTKKQIIAAHKLVARVYRDDTLLIGDEEANELAEAIMNFTKEMGFVVSGKAAATGQLALTLLAVEIPVILKVMGNRRKRPKEVVDLEPVIPS